MKKPEVPKVAFYWNIVIFFVLLIGVCFLVLLWITYLIAETPRKAKELFQEWKEARKLARKYR